ncbi:putative membrane protein [Friedmanniella endophytica]|uniref:Putative membrane protein n=1 Tax=Microlunatus kandeliicorticis TaxID=1759536 RepID=A0A7W3IQM3_9ACTN|nr:PH domain-containing protein [Microlunatus kandeliicorticis]MBA8793447.1 putative membrane protein [Microlunatus kandeliicorticis]
MTPPDVGGGPLGAAPVPAPSPPASPAPTPSSDERTQRPHPLTPVLRGWFVLVAIGLAVVRQTFENGDDNPFDALLRLGLAWLLLIIVGIVAVAALAGFVSWYFTRFVIDDTELRVESGALFKSSRRLAFERVQSVDLLQPLLARVFGLCELRIEAGAGDRPIRLRYLRRADADRFRTFLLARAQGDRSSFASTENAARASLFTDLSVEDQPVVTIKPQQLVLGFLLSTEWLIALGFVIIALIATQIFGVTFYALPGLVPLAFGAISLIGRRVIAQFNYTLAESVRGLRITRGLTNLSSQSVPLDRIQGLTICQSILWRPFGWYRVDVSVLGYGAGNDSGESRSDVSRILLPVATAEQLRVALARVLPGVDLGAVELHRSPRRAAFLRPFDAWTFRYGWDDRVVVARAGVLVNDTTVVPHARVQSARVEQGPLQRLLGLASAHLDSPKGPVRLVGRHLAAADARALVVTELDRQRASLAALAAARRPPEPPPVDAEVLDRFRLTEPELLGEGGETRVYALGPAEVLRVYKGGDPEQAARLVSQLRPAYDHWAGQTDVPLELPRILDHGRVGDRIWTVDRRMSGPSFSTWLRTAPVEARRPALLSYLDSAFELRRLEVPASVWARPFGPDPRSFPTFAALVHDQLAGALRRIDHVFFPEAETWARQVVDEVGERVAEPRLVHADYFPGNTYVSTVDGVPVVRGVADFSPHTLIADPLMDVAGASILMELEPYPGVVEDARWLWDVAAERVGADEARWFTTYRRYYSVYFGDDPLVVPWAREQLAGPRA